MVRYASHRANVISGRLYCLIANPNLKRQESRVCGNSLSCCGPGVTLGCTLWRVIVPGLWMSRRSYSQFAWAGLRHVKLKGVLPLPARCCNSVDVTSLESTARLFPAVCAACQPSLVRSNAWHLAAQLLVPAKLWRGTAGHVTEPRRKWWFGTLVTTCQWVYKVHVRMWGTWSRWYTLSTVFSTF